MSVQLPCSLRSLRTEIVRSPCGDRPSHGARAGIVQCHLRHVYGLRAYDFFKFVKLLAKPNRTGRWARESIRTSHSRLVPPQAGLAEAARKGGYGQDTGSVDPSQAKCELGMSELHGGSLFRTFNSYSFNFNGGLRKRRNGFCLLRTLSPRGKQFLWFLKIDLLRFHRIYLLYDWSRLLVFFLRCAY